MESLFDSPFVPAGAACAAVGLIVGLLARLVRLSWPAGLAAALVFLTGYYLTYNKIPAFPPMGSTSKIFYIVIFASLAGLVFDGMETRLPASPVGRGVIALLTSGAIAIWIGLPRFAEAGPGFWLLLAALALGGGLLLWRVASLRADDPPAGRRSEPRCPGIPHRP